MTVEFGKVVTKALPHPPPPSPDESPTLPFDSTEKEKREGEEQKGLPDGKQGKDCSVNFCPRCGLQIGGSSSSGHSARRAVDIDYSESEQGGDSVSTHSEASANVGRTQVDDQGAKTNDRRVEQRKAVVLKRRKRKYARICLKKANKVF